ncbi:MAG: PEP/pyruvate-binding domain-containing protein [Syntrophobacterales bacterium]|jgi:pyruvate,water dikinase
MEPILTLDLISIDDRERVGGKGFALATLARSGMKVPETVCVTVDAYHSYLATTGLGARISMELNRKDFAEVRWEEMWDAALRIRNLFMKTDIPSDLRAALENSMPSMFPGKPVAVRSSAPGEDSSRTSFAGLHESYLNVQGLAAIFEHLRLVWASLWSDRALLYRQELGLDVEKSSMAAVVQELVVGDRSGVVFGKNPNDPYQAVIESVYGLNEGLVDGRIEPDRWLVDRKSGAIISHFPATRGKLVVAARESTQLETLSVDQRDHPPLNDEEVARVFKLALEAEELFGSPQDVEWTFVGDQLFVLQSRPITTVKGKDETDNRAWYFSLRRSFANLKGLRAKVEGELIPEMEREAKAFAVKDLTRLSDSELAEELSARQRSHDRWKETYWSEFIPLAHGIRLFGEVYNDSVRPSDPYEFMDLLGATEMVSLERNRSLEHMAAMIRGDSDLAEDLRHQSYPPPDHPFSRTLNDFIDSFGDLSCSAELCTQGSDGIVRLLLEMAARPAAKERFRASDIESLTASFLSSFEGEKRENMEELLDLGRASYRLRDDDNIYLGMIQNQLRLAVEESKTRLQDRGNVRLEGLDPMEIINALNDPNYVPETAAVTRADEPYFQVRPRQLIGQPASPGVVRGSARVIDSPSNLFDFKAGEILVCDAVDPNMTFVVPLAAGIVERRGGMLIHGAIIAREYGLPCVTGVPNAASLIQTGDQLTVDGYLGIVVKHS